MTDTTNQWRPAPSPDRPQNPSQPSAQAATTHQSEMAASRSPGARLLGAAPPNKCRHRVGPSGTSRGCSSRAALSGNRGRCDWHPASSRSPFSTSRDYSSGTSRPPHRASHRRDLGWEGEDAAAAAWLRQEARLPRSGSAAARPPSTTRDVAVPWTAGQPSQAHPGYPGGGGRRAGQKGEEEGKRQEWEGDSARADGGARWAGGEPGTGESPTLTLTWQEGVRS